MLYSRTDIPNLLLAAAADLAIVKIDYDRSHVHTFPFKTHLK